jgi:signal transduction histidine kinase
MERQQRSGHIQLTDGRHFEFAAVPLPDGNALFTLLDVTASRGIEAALRERTEALEAADKLKSAFMANVSYELRVPLTSISGFAEMLAGGYAGPLADTGKEYVQAILDSVARLSALIDDVLDLTQSEAGSLPLAQDPVDIGKVAGEAAAIAGETAKARDIELAVDLSSDLVVTGDARRLRQALDHLLDNAVAYTGAGGRVLIKGLDRGDEVEIVVSDNGEGMSAEECARAFDPFHSGGKAERRSGLGLGLPLTRQFIEAHGGTISLTSEPDHGTTVVVRLPRAA